MWGFLYNPTHPRRKTHLDTLRINSPTCLSSPRMRASPDLSCICRVATWKNKTTQKVNKELGMQRKSPPQIPKEVIRHC